MPNYSIWLLEYARANEQPVGCNFAGHFNQGTTVLPFCYAVIRGEGRTMMVDVGYDYSGGNKQIADISGCTMWQPPEVVLQSIGLKPSDVDTVFLTHAHFDHMGNLGAFSNAHFYIQRKELNDWMWAINLPERFDWISIPVNPDDLLELAALGKERRLTLIDGAEDDVVPGISLIPAHDTHSFGCQYVVVENESDDSGRPWVFVGDNLFTYDNIKGADGSGVYTPIGLCHGNTIKTVLSMDELVKLVEGDEQRLIIFHEKQSWDLFPAWQSPQGLNVAEICLAPGQESLLAKS